VAKAIKPQLKGSEYEHEVSVLSHLRHPNLVLFLGACLDEGPLLIVSELMEGSLEQYMEQRAKAKGGRPPRQRLLEVHRWCVGIGRALAFLHQRTPAPLIHRDLKPSNLLLTADGQLKVADFGLAKIMRSPAAGGSYKMTGGKGTLRYMAPEVIMNEEYNDSVDIYSFGLVIWYMCTGTKPLEPEMRAVHSPESLLLLGQKLRDGLRPDQTRITHAGLVSLMVSMWASNPLKRPSAVTILSKLEEMKTDKMLVKVASRGQDDGRRPVARRKCVVS
jgi:serine/threonine protein kinase